MADIIEKIESAVKENKVMIFMKGNRSLPQCGFSAATVAIVEELGVPFATADVLSDPELRDAIKRYSNWPTIPQVYIDGKFVGGCDIIRELHETGELAPMGKAALGGTAQQEHGHASAQSSISACRRRAANDLMIRGRDETNCQRLFHFFTFSLFTFHFSLFTGSGKIR